MTSDLSEKIGEILNGSKKIVCENLDDPKKLEDKPDSIVFYNSDLPDANAILHVVCNHHFIALCKNPENGLKALENGAADYILLSNVNDHSVSKSLILAERKLKTADEQLMLNNIISNIDGVVMRHKIRKNGKSELIFLSKGYEKISGTPLDEAESNNDIVWKQIAPEDRRKVIRSFEASLNTLSPWRQIWRMVNQKGETKWIQGSGTPYKQEDGTILFDIVMTEITQLKDTTTELAEARQEFRLAAKAAQLGLWKFDPVNDTLEWDEQMHNIFGIDPKEFTGKRQEWVNSLHPDDREKSINALVDTVNTGADLEFQFRIIKKDTQEIRHIRASANSIAGKNGEAIFLVGINWDVTHLVRTQEKILESNNRYALASKAAQDAIWDLDIGTNILRWNPSFTELFGHKINLNKDHLEDWARLVHPDDYERVVVGLDKFIETGKNKWEENYRFKKGDGHYAHVVDRGFIVRDQDGKATRMVGSMRDVTANTEFLNAIKEQNKKLRKIAWKQSHELRGPLTRIMGLTALIEQDGFKDMTTEEFLTYLNGAVGELDAVIREIVDASNEIGIYDPKEQKALKL